MRHIQRMTFPGSVGVTWRGLGCHCDRRWSVLPTWFSSDSLCSVTKTSRLCPLLCVTCAIFCAKECQRFVGSWAAPELIAFLVAKYTANVPTSSEADLSSVLQTINRWHSPAIGQYSFLFPYEYPPCSSTGGTQGYLTVVTYRQTGLATNPQRLPLNFCHDYPRERMGRGCGS